MKRISKKILKLLNIIATIALCFSYLSNFINPARIWGFAFFGLAFPYLFAINFGFFLFWWWRRNRFALVVLIVLILGIGYSGRYIQFKSVKNNNIDGPSIKIISYNVRIFNYFEWENKRSVSDSIISYLTTEHPDIICLQEFFTQDGKTSLSEQSIKQQLKSLPHSYIEYSYLFNTRKSKFGIATFSKFPIVNAGKIKFNKSFNSCIFSDIKMNNDTFRVYNIHLQSIQLNKKNYDVMDSILYINPKKINEVKNVTSQLKRAYISRAEQTTAIINHMKSSPYPVILCGDFNDTPVSYTYHQLLGKKKDAYRESGSGVGNTYRGKLPSFRIDYIFYTSDFISFDYKTEKIKLSDHYPVSANLLLKR